MHSGQYWKIKFSYVMLVKKGGYRKGYGVRASVPMAFGILG